MTSLKDLPDNPIKNRLITELTTEISNLERQNREAEVVVEAAERLYSAVAVTYRDFIRKNRGIIEGLRRALGEC